MALLAPPARSKATDVRRTIALVVDDLGLAFDNMDYVKDALRKFVDTQMQPGDLVAIISSGRGDGALQQFTSDKRILHAAIKQLSFNFRNRIGIHSFAPITDTRSGREMMAGGFTAKDTESGVGEDQTKALAKSNEGDKVTNQRREEFERNYFTVGTLGAVQYVIRGLRHLPGRKSVALFSENIPMSQRDNYGLTGRLQRLTEEANRAGVVFYSLDPRGVPYTGFTASDDIHDNPATDSPRTSPTSPPSATTTTSTPRPAWPSSLNKPASSAAPTTTRPASTSSATSPIPTPSTTI